MLNYGIIFHFHIPFLRRFSFAVIVQRCSRLLTGGLVAADGSTKARW